MSAPYDENKILFLNFQHISDIRISKIEESVERFDDFAFFAD